MKMFGDMKEGKLKLIEPTDKKENKGEGKETDEGESRDILDRYIDEYIYATHFLHLFLLSLTFFLYKSNILSLYISRSYL